MLIDKQHIYYFASYVPETLNFIVLGTTSLLEDFSTYKYPLIKKMDIGDRHFISRSYDDVYFIPVECRDEHANDLMYIPLELHYSEYDYLKNHPVKTFQLDHDNETFIVNYPLSFSPSVDPHIKFKLHNGKFYKRVKLSPDGTIISDDWELMSPDYPSFISSLDNVMGELMKDLLFGDDDQPNITFN